MILTINLENKQEKKLRNNDAFAQLVFALPEYKGRKKRDLEASAK